MGAAEFWSASEDAKALVYVRQDGLIAFWSGRAQSLTGYSKDEVLERPWVEVMTHPLGGYDSLLQIPNKAGEARLLRLCIAPVEGAGWAAYLEDSTSRETVHQATLCALRESEQRYQFALKGANDGI